MRDGAIAVIREVGVAAGGCNIQFAVNPQTGEMLVIEMNPRVSRSSALASKATGFPIARIGTKVAVGYRLDELPNDITRTTPDPEGGKIGRDERGEPGIERVDPGVPAAVPLHDPATLLAEAGIGRDQRVQSGERGRLRRGVAR
jgi:biotin carboxylase